MAEIILENLSKRYPGGDLAVHNLNLHVREGELLVLVGPSGCGKTTTLRLIAGLEEPTDGTIRIGQRVVNRDQPRDRNVAMVFQDYALYPHMTVYQNMAFPLKMRKVPRALIDDKVRQAALALGITDLLQRKPKALSGGQRQRAALGRAIVRDPQCFLLDEPLSNLDASMRLQLRTEIKSLHQRLKTTTMYVTHDQEEAMTLGDRIAVMSRGEIPQIATPLEIYRRPINRFVAGFFGTPTINFIDGTLRADPAGVIFSDGAAMRLVMPAGWTAMLQPYLDQPTVLGVRPEHLNLDDDAPPSAATDTLALTIELIEALGDQVNVIGRTASGASIIVRTKAREDLQPGRRVLLGICSDQIHLFEPGDHGRNLIAGALLEINRKEAAPR